jgi:hypothetical protein
MEHYLGLVLFLWIVGASGLAAGFMDRSINRTARTDIFSPRLRHAETDHV